MKITKQRIKEIVRETIVEENEYQAFFQKCLAKAGKSIPNMGTQEKKDFFNKIDSAWQARGEKRGITKEKVLPQKSSPVFEKKENVNWKAFWKASKDTTGKTFKQYEKKYSDLLNSPHVEDAINNARDFNEFMKQINKFESVNEAANPNYFQGFRSESQHYVLIGKKDHNFYVTVSRYSDVGSTYSVYTKKGHKFIGSANSIKQGESGMKKIKVKKSQIVSSKTFKDLLDKIGVKENVTEGILKIVKTNRVTGGHSPKIRFNFSDGTELETKADGYGVKGEDDKYTSLISNWFNKSESVNEAGMEGQWVVYTGKSYDPKVHKVVKSHRAAQMMMNKMMATDKYNAMGTAHYETFKKENPHLKL